MQDLIRCKIPKTRTLTSYKYRGNTEYSCHKCFEDISFYFVTKRVLLNSKWPSDLRTSVSYFFFAVSPALSARVINRQLSAVFHCLSMSLFIFHKFMSVFTVERPISRPLIWQFTSEIGSVLFGLCWMWISYTHLTRGHEYLWLIRSVSLYQIISKCNGRETLLKSKDWTVRYSGAVNC